MHFLPFLILLKTVGFFLQAKEISLNDGEKLISSPFPTIILYQYCEYK